MHEISLVQNLIEQLRELAAINDAKRIHSVTMEIGPLSHVVVNSFRFGFDTLAGNDDFLKKAALTVLIPAVVYRCSGCGHAESFNETRPACCLRCGDRLLFPEGGDDLILRQVEME